jgi:hypothetical protein
MPYRQMKLWTQWRYLLYCLFKSRNLVYLENNLSISRVQCDEFYNNEIGLFSGEHMVLPTFKLNKDVFNT